MLSEGEDHKSTLIFSVPLSVKNSQTNCSHRPDNHVCQISVAPRREKSARRKTRTNGGSVPAPTRPAGALLGRKERAKRGNPRQLNSLLKAAYNNNNIIAVASFGGGRPRSGPVFVGPLKGG